MKRLMVLVAASAVLLACGDDTSDTTADTATTEVATDTTQTAAGSTERAPETTGPAVETTEAAPDTTEPAPATTEAATDTTASADGFTFTSPAGDYSVVFPGEPTPVDQQLTLADGTPLPFTVFTYGDDVTGGYRELAVAGIEYPPGSELSLDGVREGALGSAPEGAELSTSEPISQQGREGIEFVINLDPGGADAYYLSRVFADGNRLYQLFYVGGDIAIEDAEVTSFFDSFRFTENR